MSAIKSVNWALAWRRSIWTLVWAAMMALLVVMCLDLAANQPVIFGIVMLAAFVGSIGLAYTRISWQNGATGTAVAALVVSLLAICTHAFMEASYWSSVIDQINREVSAERAVDEARAVVAAKRTERYAASSNGRSVGQIEAEIKAAQTNPLFARTASCTDATAKDSREFCEGYWKLHAKLAAAKEADKLESVVWSAGTTVETTTKRNLAAIALLAANLFGGQPEQYTALIVITLVMFTQALLAFALVIGWAPEKARIDSTASKPSEATETPAKSLPPVSASPVHLPARSERKPIVPMIELPEFGTQKADLAPKADPVPEVGTDPDGGTPANLPKISDSSTDDEGDTDPTNVVPLRSEHTTKAELRIEKAPRASENSVSRWLRDCTGPARRNSKGQPAHKLIGSYLSYCRQRNETPLSKRKFSTVLRGELDLPKLRAADGKRKSAVMLFPLELVSNTQKKVRAA